LRTRRILENLQRYFCSSFSTINDLFLSIYVVEFLMIFSLLLAYCRNVVKVIDFCICTAGCSCLLS
jgi:hypothetical protein